MTSGLKSAIIAKDKTSTNPHTIQEVLRCLKQMGHHGSVTIQTDSEGSLLELMRQVACQRDSPTFLRRTPKEDSQANGRVERAIRSMEESSRTQKLDLQSRIGCTFSVHHPVFHWLLRHAVCLLNWRQPSHDGRTAHERAHGRPFCSELFPFCVPVLYRY